MKTTLLIITLFTSNLISAQIPNWTWAKSISVYTSDKQNITAIDNEGNVYLVGDFNDSSATIGTTTLINNSDTGFSDAFIFKFSNLGALIWYKQISTYKNDTMSAVETDSFGNVYVIGTIGDSITLGTNNLTEGYNPYYIAKLNSNGDFIWAIEDSGVADNYFFRDIKVDTSGNVFVTGASRSATLNFGSALISIDPQHATVNNTRPFVLKFNSNGVPQWGRMGTSVESNIFGSDVKSMAVDNNGGVVMCGQFHHNSLQFGAITLTKSTQNNNTNNMFVVKYDSNGAVMWAYSSGSTIPQISTSANALEIDQDNNVYLAGNYGIDIQFGNTNLSVPGFASHYYLVKYNAAGVVQWAKTPQGSDNFTTIRSLATDDSGNVYAAGLTYASFINFSPTVQLLNLSSVGSIFVAKYNSSGTPVWARAAGNIDANNAISIDCRAENDLIVGGTFNNATFQLGTSTLTNSNLAPLSGRNLYVARLFAQPLNTSVFDRNSILIYPNPVRNTLYISNLKSSHTYELYTIVGKRVLSGSLNSGQQQLKVDMLPKGLYIIEFTDDQGRGSQEKVVIE
jgi:hypothetical protein